MVSFTVFKGSEDGKIVKSSTTREIGNDEVLVKITHSGVCGTDIHFLHKDMALGHEGAGIVEKIGQGVKKLAIGDHVGWGWVHSTCGDCEQCLTGKENLCTESKAYGDADLDQGSFGTYGVWKAGYLFKIPDSMALKHAAPLMCGGATVYHAMRDVRSSDRVGVIGVGGLGHLAVQFAGKMGCDVVVFSSTDSKKAEAQELGAKQFVATKGKDRLEIGKPLNHLFVTTSHPPNWEIYLPLMAPRGTVYPITVNGGELSVPYNVLMNLEMRVQGSLVSPRQTHRNMIQFAALHGIKPIIEEFPMNTEGIEKALEKLGSGKMRYRGVLVVE
ncbi:chaperonin 10-like protein [Rhexocercosporidium sp. MPI-PUGE-AT-0058]|nr:chaperonin 10-like protein [Rhexocercosporidium sp. MPI-PUGE-AT-0058]